VFWVQGVLYFCCRELGAREKKKFKHTSYIIREKELEEVLSSNPIGIQNGNILSDVGPEGKQKPERTSSKGEDFYAGTDSLRNKQRKEAGSDLSDNSKNPLDEKKFHAGMAKIRVFEEDEHVLGDTMSDRVLA